MKKTKISIKTFGGSLLFEFEAENNTLKKTLEEAVKGDANLRYANLRDADLRYADLRYANLRYANLRYANLRYANLRYADLRYANLRDAKNLKLYWHIHHDILFENLTESLKNRIDYIRRNKQEEEIATRLKLLKKVKCKNKDLPITKAGWEKLHKEECKKCPWNGKTIFP